VYEDANWVHLGRDIIQWTAYVNTVMKNLFQQQVWKMTRRVSNAFVRWILPLGVNYSNTELFQKSPKKWLKVCSSIEDEWKVTFLCIEGTRLTYL